MLRSKWMVRITGSLRHVANRRRVQDVALVPARRQECRTQPMFTYWRRVCRHGAGRTPNVAPPSKHTNDETLLLPSFSRTICTNEFVYTNSCSVGGFGFGWVFANEGSPLAWKQVAPKPRRCL